MKDILRPATLADAVSLAGRLRPSDVREVYAASGLTPLEALLEGVRTSSPHAWTLATDQGQPYLMGGVRPSGVEGIGLVWLLASPFVKRRALTVQKVCGAMLDTIWREGTYRALSNIVAADNEKAVQWLIRLGALVVRVNCPAGIRGECFHTFAFAPEGEVCAHQ